MTLIEKSREAEQLRSDEEEKVLRWLSSWVPMHQRPHGCALTARAGHHIVSFRSDIEIKRPALSRQEGVKGGVQMEESERRGLA